MSREIHTFLFLPYVDQQMFNIHLITGDLRRNGVHVMSP